MDRVRLGRALGYGARHAVKTFAEAAKAASAPAPAGRTSSAAAQSRAVAPVHPSADPVRVAAEPIDDSRGTSSVSSALHQAASQVIGAHRTVAQAQNRVHTGAVNAGRSMLAPVRKAGGVLWLEMTGCAFSLFALFLAPGLWKLRSAVHAPPSSPEAEKFYLYLVVLLLFSYFAVSSFVRAHRRGKRP